MLKPVLLSILLAYSPVLMGATALADQGGAHLLPVAASSGMGSSKEQAACRPDVRRFCSHVKQGSDNSVFLSCLEANRSKLSKSCLAVLQSHGQ